MKRQLGFFLILLSFLFYGSLLLVPFISLSSEHKLLLSTAIVILGESSFWVAAILLGKELVSKYQNIDWISKIKELFRNQGKKI